MSSWSPTKYKTTNWSAYNEALRQRGSLTIWFDPDMEWIPPPTGKRGRQQSFSHAAIQTCLTMKVLFGMPMRPTTGFVQGPLNLLILLGQRIWRKIHIRCPLVVCKANDERGIDEETLEVRALEITGSNIGDAPVLPELLDQIPSDEEIGSVTADGAYDTRKCHEAIAARGAAPQERQAVETDKPCRRRPKRSPTRFEVLVSTVEWRPPAEAVSRPRGTASSCSANPSWPGTSTARSPSYRFVLSC